MHSVVSARVEIAGWKLNKITPAAGSNAKRSDSQSDRHKEQWHTVGVCAPPPPPPSLSVEMKINSSSLRSGGSDITCSPSLTRRSNIWVSVCYVLSNIVSVRALALRWKWTCVFVCMRECELIAMKSCFFGRWFTPPCNIFVCAQNTQRDGKLPERVCEMREWLKRIVDVRWGESGGAWLELHSIFMHCNRAARGYVRVRLFGDRFNEALAWKKRLWFDRDAEMLSARNFTSSYKKRTAKGGWRYHF